MNLSDTLQQKINALPASPGVYLLKDSKKVIFYIGKAKNLKERIRQYLQGQDNRLFVRHLERLWGDLEVILTASDKEAILLESELIRRHQPRFNVKLMDDKRYLSIQINMQHPYPRLEVIRGVPKAGYRSFGPYPSAGALKQTLRLIQRHFPLRTCSDEILKSRQKPCLLYQMQRCEAPCVYQLPQGHYQQQLQEVIAFLEGRHHDLLKNLKERMQEEANKEAFEQAARLRDQIMAIEKSIEKQQMIHADRKNRDCIGFYREAEHVQIYISRWRHGNPIQAERFYFDTIHTENHDFLADFLARYYEKALPNLASTDDPKTTSFKKIILEVLCPMAFEWLEPLSEVLSQNSHYQLYLSHPQRGPRKEQLAIASDNAKQTFISHHQQQQLAQQACLRLQEALKLPIYPKHMACFDISHLMGKHIVASCVTFINGIAHKKLYRHYNIQSITDQNDFQAIYEVVSRRAKRGLENHDLPDLWIIDGGKAQRHAADQALQDAGVDAPQLIALAKSRRLDTSTSTPAAAVDLEHDHGSYSTERIFVADEDEAIVLPQNSPELLLLTQIRDEAHRFAIGHHRRQRSKKALRSWLEDVPHIGDKRRQLLLRRFGSLAGIRQASQKDLIDCLGEKAAQSLLLFLSQLHERTLLR